MTPYRPSTAHVVVAWVMTLVTGGYMLPWAAAASLGRRNSLAIGLLTFFLGWSIIGWVAALIWALVPDGSPTVTVTGSAPHQGY